MCLVEFIICFDMNVADTCERKQARCQCLKGDLLPTNRWRCHLWPVQVGDRGIVDERSLTPLHDLCKVSSQGIACLYESLVKTSLTESFKIWCSKKRTKVQLFACTV